MFSGLSKRAVAHTVHEFNDSGLVNYLNSVANGKLNEEIVDIFRDSGYWRVIAAYEMEKIATTAVQEAVNIVDMPVREMVAV